MRLRPGANPLSAIDRGDREEGDWWDDRADLRDDDAEDSYWSDIAARPMTIAQSNALADGAEFIAELDLAALKDAAAERADEMEAL